MTKLLTIMETRAMSHRTIEMHLGEHVNELEKLGMDRIEACKFVSSIMNLGIAVHELIHKNDQK